MQIAAAAISSLEEWGRHDAETNAYELRRSGPSNAELAALVQAPPPRRGLLLAGVLMGASLMLGALGYYVVERTRAADAESAALAASARAVIEAENDRKLREADIYAWPGQAGAGSRAAAATSGSAAAEKKRP
jgi:hypothetical protein